jgi:hypothetical protein
VSLFSLAADLLIAVMMVAPVVVAFATPRKPDANPAAHGAEAEATA